MKRRTYLSGRDNLLLISNSELKKCNYFCLNCLSSYIYTHIKTPDYVCRKCGSVTTIEAFENEIKSIIERRNKSNKDLSVTKR